MTDPRQQLFHAVSENPGKSDETPGEIAPLCLLGHSNPGIPNLYTGLPERGRGRTAHASGKGYQARIDFSVDRFASGLSNRRCR